MQPPCHKEFFNIVSSNQVQEPCFLWKDRHNQYHNPRTMYTRHLYFTLCMIWNHSVPYKYRTYDFIQYEFGPFYTTEYMAKAVINIAYELAQRNDLTPQWKDTLTRMVEIVQKEVKNVQAALPEVCRDIVIS